MKRTILCNTEAPKLRGAAVMYGLLRNLKASRAASAAACVRYLLGIAPTRVVTPTCIITIDYFSVS